MRKKSKDTIWDCLNTILNEECYCPTVDNNFFNDELNRISNTVEENLSKLDKEKENGIVKIKIKSPNLNLDKEFKLDAKESFEDVEKEFRKIFSEEFKNKDMKDIIEKVDKKNKLNEKNIVENNFNSDFVDFLEKLFPITEENKIEGKITCCKDCDESQCVGNCCKVGVITNEELRKRIFNGERLENIFDEVGKWDNNGIACVRHNGLYNFINTKIQLISDEWFDSVSVFHEGFATIKLNGKGWNFINQNGELINPNQWFDNVYAFYNGFARVYLDGKGWNFMNQKGEIAFPNQWFDDAESFSEGFAKVFLNGKTYYINGKGELYDRDKKFISNLREFLNEEEMNENEEGVDFDNCTFFKNGFAEITTSDGGVMWIDKNGKIMERVTPDDYWRSDNTLDVSENNTQGLNSGNSLNEEEMNENEEGVDVYTPTYQLFDSGGIYNPMFYNAVHYICETVHFPLSDIYRFEEKIELDELDGVILIPNVWGKLIDGEIEYFGEYIKNGGKVYVIDPNSFELTLVDSFSKLWDYAMTTTQMECL